MNDSLKKLYSSKWNELNISLKSINEDAKLDIKPANPLLLYIDKEEEYKNADIRLMIFGQETNSWYEKENGSIDEIQALYDGFFNEGDCWNYGGHFWNGVNRFIITLKKKFPNKVIRLIWNNIVKLENMETKVYRLTIYMKPKENAFM